MPNRKVNNLVIGIYFHPEAYPPTLNAVGELSECFDHITIIHRPHLNSQWKYPSNVTAIPSGDPITSMEQENAPLKKKILFFLQFTTLLFKTCKRQQPVVILVYDSLSLLAYKLVRPFLPSHKIWYHNHDVNEIESMRKYSISWFAAKHETAAFKYLDIFSLPTDERLRYFPMDKFKGQYFFIPNYPAIKFYKQFYKPRKLSQQVRVIFQGSIGPLHGIEEIIPLLHETINGHGLELVLKGPCRSEFRDLCIELARQHKVEGKITFLGVTPYREVPLASSTCDIGIGILAKQDIMNTTLGTASNKIYEYAAVGLPVIYYDRPNFTQHLGKYLWAIPTELASEEIKIKIAIIIESYERLSDLAHRDFIGGLNYEKGFKNAKAYVANLLNFPSKGQTN